jgi:ATP-dependent protease HslVU (ClpYQ) ATPase subunit
MERAAVGCTGKDVAKFIVDIERKLNSFSSKIQADITTLDEMDAKVKVLEGKVSRNCAETEARINNMARSGEKNAADTNSKMDDLADALISLELTMQEILSRDIPFPAGVESMRSDILKDVGDKFDSKWLGAKLVFEAEQDCRMDAKAKTALREVLGTDVRSALKELVEEATTNALRVAFECFPLPMQEEMETNLKKMTCAEYDQRQRDQQEAKN